MNLLIAQDGFETNNVTHDGWVEATHFFTHPKLLHALATLLTVQNDSDSGESYDAAIDETINALISKRIDDEDESAPAPILTEDDRVQVFKFLKDSVNAMRPYMPTGGSLELITYVMSVDLTKFYLVVRYHENDEHTGKAFASPGVRG